MMRMCAGAGAADADLALREDDHFYDPVEAAEQEDNFRDIAAVRDSFFSDGVHQPPTWGCCYRNLDDALLHIRSWGGQRGSYRCWEDRGRRACPTEERACVSYEPP